MPIRNWLSVGSLSGMRQLKAMRYVCMMESYCSPWELGSVLGSTSVAVQLLKNQVQTNSKFAAVWMPGFGMANEPLKPKSRVSGSTAGASSDHNSSCDDNRLWGHHSHDNPRL